MTTQQVLSQPSVQVGTVQLAVSPNSVKLIDAFGKAVVETALQGGQLVTVISTDIADGPGKLTLEVPSTQQVLALPKQWAAADQTVKLFNAGILVATFTNARLVNKPEMALAASGKMTLEFATNNITYQPATT